MVFCYSLPISNNNHFRNDIVAHVLNICDSRTKAKTSKQVKSIYRSNPVSLFQILQNPLAL